LKHVVTSCREGVLVSVRVTARAQRDEVVGVCVWGEGAAALSVRVRAAPAEGKANEAVVAAISAAFGVPKSSVRIKSGGGGRNKVLLVAGDPDRLQAIFTKELEERKWRRD
jgi:uncharacterized protein (TIGR00251 family)